MENLKKIIIKSLNLEGISSDEIGDHDPLIGGGLGLDSVDALELIVVLEKEYGIKIRSNELDPSIFSSVANLKEFIDKKTIKIKNK